MIQPSRDYSRLLNTLIDQRIAAAPKRSPWFHLTPGERADYLDETDARLLEIQHTTLNVLAAQHLSMDNNPQGIDEHLAMLRRHREALDSHSPYRQALDRDISLYSRQQAAMHGFEGAWRKGLRLIRAGDGLRNPCAGLLQRLQRMIDLLQRKIDSEGDARRVTPFARQQGWKALAERYRALLDGKPVDLAEVPAASDGLPVNLSLLLMEERPGYVRMNVALVDADFEGRYKDMHLEHGRLVTATRSLMNFSFGTAARSLAWQQHYRLKHEPGRSPTFAPIRSVLVRTAFVEVFLGHWLVSEHTLRSGFLVRVMDDGSRLRVINVDRKECNQIGIEAFDEPGAQGKVREVDLPRRLEDLLNRYADIASFQTIAVDSYAASHYDPDRDGRFVGIRELERSVGFGQHLYLLELPHGRDYLAVTPFAVVDRQGSRHLRGAEVQRAWAHNSAFFERLHSLREQGEGACPWLNSPRERAAFTAQWQRLLERNHLTPGALLAVPEAPRASLRDGQGNALGKMLRERALADRIWCWPALDASLAAIAARMLKRGGLQKLLDDAYVQATLAQATRLPGLALEPMPHRARNLRLLKWLLGEDQQAVAESRDLRRQLLFQVLRLRAGQLGGGHAQVNPHGLDAGNALARPDPWLILNARPERLLAGDNRWLIAEDKYRSTHQWVPDPLHPATRYMDELDTPFIGGISAATEALCRDLPQLFDGLPSLPEYWRFQLANSAFWLRNGYHSLFETLYMAARYEPLAEGSVGDQLLALFDRGRDHPASALYRDLMALLRPLIDQGLSGEERLAPDPAGC
ncbi:hypothetical protein CSV86_008635 [Pseudomonas putida CSV86]|uniref:Uncharacterized protein n=1 Tax=Pseudomonas bharatica CSV86 TaxID=1005395 RepID=L1LTX3_9PSED|nr:hypothetical protein [Pseudomonas bharatica]NNJ15300.1 hypothetical protein [Pseudomonas bharatica CSV86]